MINIKNFRLGDDKEFFHFFTKVDGLIFSNKLSEEGFYNIKIIGEQKDAFADFLTFEDAERFYNDLILLILIQNTHPGILSIDIAEYGHNEARQNKINSILNKE